MAPPVAWATQQVLFAMLFQHQAVAALSTDQPFFPVFHIRPPAGYDSQSALELPALFCRVNLAHAVAGATMKHF
jgi:hypothetical protein